jgi:hypothetical protein
MIEVLTVHTASTIEPLESIEAVLMLALVHVFLDNAHYHHAKLLQEWLLRPGCGIKLHFIQPYRPHVNPIERAWDGHGVSRTETVRTTSAMQLARDPPMRRPVSCAKTFPRIGRTSVTRSPMIFAASTQRIFGSGLEWGIARYAGSRTIAVDRPDSILGNLR